TELTAFTFTGDAADIGAGSVLGVELRANEVEDACGVCGGDDSSCDAGCGPNEPGIPADNSIRDQAGYIAGTGFSIAADGTIADQFQINLEYQAGVDSDAVDTWNDWAGAIGDGVGVNWHDPHYYTLLVDPDGGLEATTYNGTDNPNHADDSGSLQWTITGWDQTILAGYIDGNRLVVSPPNTYRPFDPNLNVNVQEDFSGLIQTELTAFTFTGDAADIGAGTVLGVELRDDSDLACNCDGDFEDCAGSCGGSAEVDECGDCGGSGIADGACDCDGNVDAGCG
ncbi:uncharacterized protein METZ01_LOCUS403257, partial [marine metagenome]